MYSNTPTTIPAYGAHHHHHSGVREALGVLALLTLVLRDPNPSRALRDLVAGVGMLIGALVGAGILIHLWSISRVLVGLVAVGCFLLHQRCTETRRRQAVATELGRRAYYLTELALVATPHELAMVPGLWDVAEVSFATHDTVCALETRWDTLFPAQFPSQADQRSYGRLCRCRPDQQHHCERPTTINIPVAANQLTAQHRRIAGLIGRAGADFVVGAPTFRTHRIPLRGKPQPLRAAMGNTAPIPSPGCAR